MKKLVRAKSLSEQVADAVGEEISNGTLKLGQMISETMISEQLGVSRTPVREAFTRLEYKGLLITKPRSGTYVFEVDETARTELYGVSSGLELQGMRLSVQSPLSGLQAELAPISEEMQSAFSHDQSSYHMLNAQFHKLFVQHSGNSLLLDIYETLQHKIRALNAAGYIREQTTELSHSTHLAIAKHIGNNNCHEAFALLLDHLAPMNTQPT